MHGDLAAHGAVIIGEENRVAGAYALALADDDGALLRAPFIGDLGIGIDEVRHGGAQSLIHPGDTGIVRADDLHIGVRGDVRREDDLVFRARSQLYLPLHLHGEKLGVPRRYIVKTQRRKGVGILHRERDRLHLVAVEVDVIDVRDAHIPRRWDAVLSMLTALILR